MESWFCTERRKIPIENSVEGDGMSPICAYHIPGGGPGLACDNPS